MSATNAAQVPHRAFMALDDEVDERTPFFVRFLDLLHGLDGAGAGRGVGWPDAEFDREGVGLRLPARTAPERRDGARLAGRSPVDAGRIHSSISGALQRHYLKYDPTRKAY